MDDDFDLDDHIALAEENAADDPDFLADAAEPEVEVEDEDEEEVLQEDEGIRPADSGDELVSEVSTSDGNNEPSAQSQEGSPRPTADDKGNFVDENGNIIASAGVERRLYERAQRAETLLNTQRDEYQKLQQTVEDQRALNGVPQKLGLSEKEAELGMDLMARMKTNPVETSRFILQEAMQQGYNLNQILGDVEGLPASSVDMGAMQRMLDEKLQPILQERQQAQEREQRETEARTALANYIATHEYADVHMDAIQNLMQNNSQMTSERAYFEVRQFAATNGLDFSQPLAPQMQAKTQQPVAPQQPPAPRPMPNGSVVSTTETQQPDDISADDDWEKIIHSSMADAGMQ